ncbi:hypothetical protein [Streptomyces sp. NPDC048650]|uniref:hypothetical protein n=1 Tax=unclassified Streptomyces TaxID=2593676 RepID=UPI003724B803
MQFNAVETTKPGTVLLLAAAPLGKGRMMDAGSVLPMLSAVPPSAWAGTETATLIELADPVEPQAVITRIRAAAAAEGPLTLVLAGQLQLDRRQHVVHLALARTTPATLRYTALPWPWLLHELQQRRPGTTTVFADLVADPETWERLAEKPLDFGSPTAAYGVISPPPHHRRIARPRYTDALTQVLRTGYRPTPTQLHQEAVRIAGTSERALVFGAETGHRAPTPRADQAPPPAPTLPQQTQRAASPHYVPGDRVVPLEEDPHERIVAASKAGHHREAAELAFAAERRALQEFGLGTHPTVHWTEVRAYLASVAGEPRVSCELWLSAANVRLSSLHQAPDAQDVKHAVDRAHHQWTQVRDAARARELAPALVHLRRQVPGRQHGALDAIQKRLDQLDGPRPRP